ncbi:hypothetical protein ILYODFUR_012354 [Ilyodon furcidens]|uniref:Uncharacterized protein n=1 Tax=Ilyodon furcidens TaxID=33524 RepID=A0ABV0VDC8_9TELE
MLLSVLLLLVGHAKAGYNGAVFTYSTKDVQGKSFSVMHRYKLSYSSYEELELRCTGCSNTEESRGEWCLGEFASKWKNMNCGSYDDGMNTGNWIHNRNGISTSLAQMFVEVRNRSDINKPNSSPQTRVLPVVRVPSNCPRNISLLTFDPDGDEVKCRYASSSSECDTCTPPSVFSLSSFCTLSFSPTDSSSEGPYAVQLMMEDFPRETITLTQNNGSISLRNTSSAISKIPVQFVFKVDPAAPSCTEGEYLPRFLSPTPEHGAQIFIDVNQTLEIPIRAEATQSVITELLFSGPANVVKNSSGSGHFTLRWTPSGDENDESHPICFVVQANVASSVYQSVHRCVVVTVGNRPTVTSTTVVAPTIPLTTSNPPPRTSYLTVLKLRISTTLSLKDNHEIILKAIKDELIRRGLHPDIKVYLRSNGSVEVKKTAAP